jgi:hypothetical protein
MRLATADLGHWRNGNDRTRTREGQRKKYI